MAIRLGWPCAVWAPLTSPRMWKPRVRSNARVLVVRGGSGAALGAATHLAFSPVTQEVAFALEAVDLEIVHGPRFSGMSRRTRWRRPWALRDPIEARGGHVQVVREADRDMSPRVGRRSADGSSQRPGAPLLGARSSYAQIVSGAPGFGIPRPCRGCGERAAAGTGAAGAGRAGRPRSGTRLRARWLEGRLRRVLPGGSCRRVPRGGVARGWRACAPGDLGGGGFARSAGFSAGGAGGLVGLPADGGQVRGGPGRPRQSFGRPWDAPVGRRSGSFRGSAPSASQSCARGAGVDGICVVSVGVGQEPFASVSAFGPEWWLKVPNVPSRHIARSLAQILALRGRLGGGLPIGRCAHLSPTLSLGAQWGHRWTWPTLSDASIARPHTGNNFVTAPPLQLALGAASSRGVRAPCFARRVAVCVILRQRSGEHRFPNGSTRPPRSLDLARALSCVCGRCCYSQVSGLPRRSEVEPARRHRARGRRSQWAVGGVGVSVAGCFRA